MNKILATLMAIAVALSACNKDDAAKYSVPDPDSGLPEYTVMLYGCGGGNLDPYFDFNLQEVEAMGYQEDVQFTAMFKYSASWKEEHTDEEYDGTRLLTMETNGEMSNTKFGDNDLRLDNPQNLADFIIDAKRRLPAKKYVLIIGNHGTGFDIRDQLVETDYISSKGVCFDDNTDDNSLSIFELDAALDLVGEKMDMLYWNACLMNTIENIYQIHDHFDYILGSNYTSYLGGYSILLNGFMTSDSIVEAGKYYAERQVEVWSYIGPEVSSSDLALIQCDKIERVVELIGDACDILCEYRDCLEEGEEDAYYYYYLNGDSSVKAKEYYESESYDKANPKYFYTEGGTHYYYMGGFNMIDLCPSLRFFSLEYYNAELSAVTTLLDDAVDDMYLCREHYYLPSETLTQTSVSITWMSDVAYKYTYPSEENYAVASLEELYRNLAFDKATGWGSKFLAGNVMKAVGRNESEEFYYLDNKD